MIPVIPDTRRDVLDGNFRAHRWTRKEDLSEENTGKRVKSRGGNGHGTELACCRISAVFVTLALSAEPPGTGATHQPSLLRR
jgi:hypothetical protein